MKIAVMSIVFTCAIPLGAFMVYIALAPEFGGTPTGWVTRLISLIASFGYAAVGASAYSRLRDG